MMNVSKCGLAVPNFGIGHHLLCISIKIALMINGRTKYRS